MKYLIELRFKYLDYVKNVQTQKTYIKQNSQFL